MPPFDGQIPPGLAGMIGGGAPGAPPGPGGPPHLPPSLMGGPPGAGPMAAPQGNPGNAMAAVSKIKSALTLLQEALPAIPMGSDVHGDVLKAVSMLAKHASSDQQGTDQQQITQLMALMQKLAQQRPNAALANLAPNAPPAMPPPPEPGGPPGGPPGLPMAS